MMSDYVSVFVRWVKTPEFQFNFVALLLWVAAWKRAYKRGQWKRATWYGFLAGERWGMLPAILQKSAIGRH